MNLPHFFDSAEVKASNQARIAEIFRLYNSRMIRQEEHERLLRAAAEDIAAEQHPELMALAYRYNTQNLTDLDRALAKWYAHRHPTFSFAEYPTWEAFLADPRIKANDQIYGRCKVCLIEFEKACRLLEKLSEIERNAAYATARNFETYRGEIPPDYSPAMAQWYGAYYNLAFASQHGGFSRKDYSKYAAARLVLDVSAMMSWPKPGDPGYVLRQPLLNPEWGSVGPKSLSMEERSRQKGEAAVLVPAAASPIKALKASYIGSSHSTLEIPIGDLQKVKDGFWEIPFWKPPQEETVKLIFREVSTV